MQQNSKHVNRILRFSHFGKRIGREGKGREGKEREGKGREGKRREGKGREGKGREGKGREGKGREGKGREGKGRGANLLVAFFAYAISILLDFSGCL